MSSVPSMTSFSFGAGTWSLPMNDITRMCFFNSTTSGQGICAFFILKTHTHTFYTATVLLGADADSSPLGLLVSVLVVWVYLVPAQVVHLLLSPQPDDFTRVQFAEAIFEAIVVFDVAISVLKLVECGLKHLQHHLLRNRLLLQAGTHTHTHIRF